MNTTLSTIAFAALAATISAQNTNQDAPFAHNILAYESGAKIHISYRQFTFAKGQTFEALASGKAPAASLAFLNDRYIPGVLDGRIELTANATIAEIDLEAGKYRFSFRIDEDAIWNLEIYTDTGKKSDGKLWEAENGWWTQEDKIASIALDTLENAAGKVDRLTIAPMASIETNKGAGNLRIDFGPVTAEVPFALAKPIEVGTAEASADKGKSGR